MTIVYDIIADGTKNWNAGDWHNKVIRTRQTVDPGYDIHKILVTLVIEKVLLVLGSSALQKTNEALEECHFYISDCYDNPQYLKKVLKELYGKSYNEITRKIQKELQDFAYHKKIEEFLQVLRS